MCKNNCIVPLFVFQNWNTNLNTVFYFYSDSCHCAYEDFLDLQSDIAYLIYLMFNYYIYVKNKSVGNIYNTSWLITLQNLDK